MKKTSGLFLIALCAFTYARLRAEDRAAPTWLKPQISVYNPPPVEKSTSTVFQAVDPQIIQKLIDLLDETNLGALESGTDTPSLEELKAFITPEGLELKNRYTRLGVVLSESLGWEEIKHVRVISEQNLKQRLTTVARWDHTPNVRTIALIALAALKDKNDAVYFREALWSRNIGIRHATIEALLKWGQPEAASIFRELTEKDESSLIRVTAATALAKLNDPAGLAKLRENLSAKDWMVRSLSAQGLGDSGNDEDYDLLVDQLNREQGTNTNEFVLAEISIAALKLFPQKIEKERLEKEKKRKKNLQASPPPQAKKAFARKDVLFELDPLVVTAPRLKIPPDQLVDSRINFQLLKMLQDNTDLRLSQAAADQSQAYKDLNQLVTPSGVRLKARYTVLGFLLTEGLAGTTDFQLVDQLMRLAREGKNPNVKCFAVVALGYSRDRSNLGLFQDALRSSNASDRFAAIEALQIWKYDEAVSILIGVTKLDTSPVIRAYASQALLRLGNPAGRDVLLRSLDDADWVARAMAMRYFGELGGAEDYTKILSYLGSSQTRIVQAEMCSALLRLYAKKFEQDGKEQ